MSFNDHNRYKVVQRSQHLYQHGLDEFTYGHPALPSGSLTIEQALDYIFEVLYPRVAVQVATPADLPTGIDTPNLGDIAPAEYEQRLVSDDGDGSAAIYMFYKMDGQPASQWNKVGDLDYGANTVIQGLLDQTQYLFARKMGSTDFDQDTGIALAGKDAGQAIFGGNAPNQNLTLNPTNGDDAGVNTGFVQVRGQFRPYDDLVFSSGTAAERWLEVYMGTAIIGTGTMTITSSAATGSITDTSGVITFDDENLLTTGNVNASILQASTSLVIDDTTNILTATATSIISSSGALSFGGNNLSTSGTATIQTMAMAGGLITDTTGLISFADENLLTTGTLGAGQITATSVLVDDVSIDGNSVSITTLNTNLNLGANGTGVVDILSDLSGINAELSGNLTVLGTGNAILNDITISGSTISSTADVGFADSIVPTVDGTLNIGSAALKWNNIYLSGFISDGTGDYLSVDLMRMSRNAYRDVAKTQPAQAGDVLFYDTVSGKWLASAPDTEIDHAVLTGLTSTDAGHTQFAMLAGRTGGQSILGDDGGGSGNLTLGSSSTGNLLAITAGSVQPVGDETLQLGGAANRFTDLHMTGQAFGLRLENTANPVPLFNAADIGRAAFNTADGFLYVNNGAEFKRVGNNSYNATHTNIELLAAIDVSAGVDDARDCIWQLCDIAGNEEIMAVPIQKTTTSVTIANTVPLPAGSYRLIGIQV